MPNPPSTADMFAGISALAAERKAKSDAGNAAASAYYQSVIDDPASSPAQRAAAAQALAAVGTDGGGIEAAAYNSAQARSGQDRLAAELWKRQSGEAPSVAEQQLRASTQANIRENASAAASAGGGGFGEVLAGRQAAHTSALQRQQMAGQAAQLRAGEQAQAEGALGALYGDQRGQDLNHMQSILGYQTAQQQRKAEAEARSNDRTDKYIGMGLSTAGAIGGGMAFGPAGAVAGYEGGSAFASQGRGADSYGGTGNPYVSDPKLKKDITPADGSDWLAEVQPVAYRYRDPELQASGGRLSGEVAQDWAGGNRKLIGVLTSDLEKSPAGQQMVIDTPRGKAIDPTSAQGPILAALADINRRLAAIEKGGK